MRAPPICDLHTHSFASDGTCAPAEVVRRARDAGVSALALTDHDTTEGLDEARAEAQALGIAFLSGVEISARDAQGAELHILGYGFDPGNPALAAGLAQLRGERRARIPRILERLRALGIDLDPAEVRVRGGSPGRPHVARALVARGVCSDVDDAFERFLGARAPAFVAKPSPPAARAIALVREAGGVTALAHPFLAARNRPGGLAALVAPLVGAGLDGLEVHYPSHAPREVRRAAQVARRFGLLATGGSDFHGASRPELAVGVGRGDLLVPRALFDAVRARCAP